MLFTTMTDTMRNDTTIKADEGPVSYPFSVYYAELEEGLTVAYCDEGKSSEVILFLQGLGSGIPLWSENIRVLRKRYRCIAVDLPGHGFSDKGSFIYSMAFYADTVIRFLEFLNLRCITLAGHSMGSQIAMHVAMQRADLVDKLICVSPAGFEPYYPHERFLLDSGMALLAGSAHCLSNNRLTYLKGFDYDTKAAERLISSLVFFKRDSLAFSRMLYLSTKAMLSEPVTELLGQLKPACLVIAGCRDIVSPYGQLRTESYADMVFRLSRQIPDVKAVQVKSGAHFLPYQLPKLFNKEVSAFIAGSNL